MTVINPNSISGITSITLPSGDGNVLTIHTNDGTERFRIDSSGNVKVGSACTISQDGDVFFTGVCTATTLTGAASGLTGALPAISGANLTNLPAANLTGALPAISGANLTGIAATDNVRTGILDVAGIATFRNDVNIGAAVTISESGIEASGIGITVANINGGQISGRRNMVINGKAQVNQRGDSTGNTSGGYYGPDRFETSIYGGTFSHSRSTSGSTLPEFPRCIKIDCTSAASAPTSTQELKIGYLMEGQDVQHLQYGTSSAKSTTLSFYVRSNKTETYTAWFYRPDGTRHNAVNFSVSAADTWEKKIITIVGDTTSTINDDNTMGFKIDWILSTGADYKSGSALNGSWGALTNANRYVGNTGTFGQSTSDYFEITGVQFEVGTQATAFEHRSYGEELKLCRRYYEQIQPQLLVLARYSHHDGNGYTQFYFEVEKRSAPSGSYTGTFESGSGYSGNPQFSYNDASITQAINIQGSNSITAGGINYLHGSPSDPGICKFDAEL